MPPWAGLKLAVLGTLLAALAQGCGSRSDGEPGRADSGPARALADSSSPAAAPAKVPEAPPSPAPDAGAPLVLQPEGLTKLPRPRLDRPATLMQALEKRRSTREFADAQLPAQLLSELLWAAAGINRPAEGKRTAPSAHDRQEVEVYVTLAQGAFRYRPAEHALERAVAGDLRALTGTQGYVATAPVNLVYVADLAKLPGAEEQDQLVTSATDTGFIAQNVYLYCAAEGLATVVRGSIDTDALARALELGSEQRVVLAQSVGFPAR